MGEVFLARRAGSPELLVLKRVLPRLAAQPEFFDRFLHEARVVARLSDPTVVRIVELGDVDGQWFLAMEYVDGLDLQALLSRGALPLAGACRVGLEALTALGVAHGARDAAGRPTPVVHRDVSPHNLLVSPAGEVKLIDFGVASLQGEGATGGKLAYAAPEQLLEDVADPRSDLYSVGVVLFECLTGHSAFDADEDVEVIRRVTEEGLPPLPGAIPAGLAAVVARLSALDPALRFPHARDAHAALLAETRALRLDVSTSALAGRAPARATAAGPVALAAAPSNAQALDARERSALSQVRDGMTLDDAELALGVWADALDLLQALVEKGALVLKDHGGERRFFRTGP